MAPSTVVVDESGGTKLPIYSAPSEPLRVIETQTRLEQHVGEARRALASSTESLRKSVHENVSSWIGVERRVERKVLEIIPDDEPLSPGLIYVGVATLAGSVFGRYRSFPIRFLSPPLFLLGSLNYFLPKTSHNLSLYYQQVESAHLPPIIKEQRESLVKSAKSLWRQADDKAHVAARKVEGGWKGGLEKVQEGTGLKIAPTREVVVEHRAPPGTKEARQT
ncbi:hypothetical protein BCV69DRAFT_282513 [Microstroma glucosiphilum]|uniref:MICOS complex subunit n=1 Tax=Pseudomicrostroma glucosiphilum TaxID=1684307 RepID=A0A316U704_9BASI|nr:hypothetical protein BCV69DRAFT_282513 [Pseudomicrostroma glucosiphilum]PWN21010.1 hypothetical protein BCV69DRAFT_282513 [Pseudomicrostroma glucosiphilum]